MQFDRVDGRPTAVFSLALVQRPYFAFVLTVFVTCTSILDQSEIDTSDMGLLSGELVEPLNVYTAAVFAAPVTVSLPVRITLDSPTLPAVGV